MARRRKVGRPPRTKAGNSERVYISLTAAEHARWSRAAGDVPVAAWARDLVNRELARR